MFLVRANWKHLWNLDKKNNENKFEGAMRFETLNTWIQRPVCSDFLRRRISSLQVHNWSPHKKRLYDSHSQSQKALQSSRWSQFNSDVPAQSVGQDQQHCRAVGVRLVYESTVWKPANCFLRDQWNYHWASILQADSARLKLEHSFSLRKRWR